MFRLVAKGSGLAGGVGLGALSWELGAPADRDPPSNSRVPAWIRRLSLGVETVARLAPAAAASAAVAVSVARIPRKTDKGKEERHHDQHDANVERKFPDGPPRGRWEPELNQRDGVRGPWARTGSGGHDDSPSPSDPAKVEAERDRLAARARSFSLAGRLIVWVANLNGGAYVKLAQVVASGAPALPQELTSPCALMQDQAPSTPLDAVVRQVECPVDSGGLGAPLDTLFSEFEDAPVASGSIAQVHRAICASTGQEVAVKVQHPRMREKAAADARGVEMLSWIASALFPGFEFAWVARELSLALDMETDFLREADHADEARRMLDGLPRGGLKWIVPEVRRDLTSRRVLTAEFIHGSRIDDPEGIVREGGDPRTVADGVVRGFAQMMFLHGFVHGDPHPGNLMFSRGRIVLLDHGLYRRFDPVFRKAICKLWRGLTLLDAAEVENEARVLGAGDLADALGLVLTGRLPGSSAFGGALGRSPTPEQREAIRARFRSKGLHDWKREDFMRALEGLPRDLLYMFRVQNLVRSINYALGGTRTRRLHIFAEAAIDGVHGSTAAIPVSFSHAWDRWRRTWHLSIIDTIVWAFDAVRWLKSFITGTHTPPAPAHL